MTPDQLHRLVAAVRAKAEAAPVPYSAIVARNHENEGRGGMFPCDGFTEPGGAHVLFVCEYQRPGVLCRHLRIEGPGPMPDPARAFLLSRVFGFTGNPFDLVVSAEHTGERFALHLVQPMSGNLAELAEPAPVLQ